MESLILKTLVSLHPMQEHFWEKFLILFLSHAYGSETFVKEHMIGIPFHKNNGLCISVVKFALSGGEIRYFGPGHILYATDTDGKGHRSTIIEEGRSLIVTADIETQDESLPHGTGAGSLGVGSNVRGDIV